MIKFILILLGVALVGLGIRWMFRRGGVSTSGPAPILPPPAPVALGASFPPIGLRPSKRRSGGSRNRRSNRERHRQDLRRMQATRCNRGQNHRTGG